MAVNFELADEEPAMQPDRDEVIELVQRRDAILGWLDRLDDQRGTANPRVLERVRMDYEERLSQTLEALGRHRSAIADELDAARARLHAAETERAEAGDRVEELHLRHRIGEITSETFEQQRDELESVAEKAQEAERQAAADVGRLQELLGQLTDTEEGDASEVTLVAEPAAPLGVRASEDADEFADPVAHDADEPDFLADIDRALAENPDDVTAAGAADLTADPDTDADTAPKPGLKCPECGYTNDTTAWFCGVCGADIG